jgi:cbb3-type cytochrome oxidase subunit 3
MTFDINFVRGVATLILFLGFLLLIFHVIRPKNKQLFEAHASIPLEDDQTNSDTPSISSSNH